jgi:hypothetical protein
MNPTSQVGSLSFLRRFSYVISLKPGISLVALRWTFSNAVICFFLYGFQTEIGILKMGSLLQNDIQELENWSDKWLLRFHPDKCKVLSAGKQKTQQYKYTLCNTELQYRIGPNTLPCGIPLVTGAHSE